MFETKYMKWGFVVIFTVVVIVQQQSKSQLHGIRMARIFVFAQHYRDESSKGILKKKKTQWRQQQRRNKRSGFGFSMSSSSLNCRRVFFICMVPLFECDGSMCLCLCMYKHICAEFMSKRFDSLVTWEIHCVWVPSILYFFALSSHSNTACIIHTGNTVVHARKYLFLYVFTFSHHQGNKQHKSTYNEWKRRRRGKKIPRRQWEKYYKIIKKNNIILKRNKNL